MAGQEALGGYAEEEAADGRGEVEEDEEGEEERPHEEGVHQDVDPVAVVRAVERVVLLEIEHALEPHGSKLFSALFLVLVFGKIDDWGCANIGVQKKGKVGACVRVRKQKRKTEGRRWIACKTRDQSNGRFEDEKLCQGWPLFIAAIYWSL